MKINHAIFLTGLVGASVGVVAGYSVAYKRIEKLFADRLADEVAFAKDFYTKLYKEGDFETPEKAVEVLIPDATVPAARAREALATYKADPEGMEALKGTVVKYHPQVAPSNIWDSGPTPADLGEETPAHDKDKPYRISAADFIAGDEYDQVTYTWYSGDEVLATEDDEKIDIPDEVVGLWNMSQFGVDTEDKNTLYVRNELLRIEFEVVKSEGRYDVEVLGHTFDQPG